MEISNKNGAERISTPLVTLTYAILGYLICVVIAIGTYQLKKVASHPTSLVMGICYF